MILSCSDLGLVKALSVISRGECPITVASFLSAEETDVVGTIEMPEGVEAIWLTEFPGALASRQFDYVIATSLLNLANDLALLKKVKQLLKPGAAPVLRDQPLEPLVPAPTHP